MKKSFLLSGILVGSLYLGYHLYSNSSCCESTLSNVVCCPSQPDCGHLCCNPLECCGPQTKQGKTIGLASNGNDLQELKAKTEVNQENNFPQLTYPIDKGSNGKTAGDILDRNTND